MDPDKNTNSVNPVVPANDTPLVSQNTPVNNARDRGLFVMPTSETDIIRTEELKNNPVSIAPIEPRDPVEKLVLVRPQMRNDISLNNDFLGVRNPKVLGTSEDEFGLKKDDLLNTLSTNKSVPASTVNNSSDQEIIKPIVTNSVGTDNAQINIFQQTNAQIGKTPSEPSLISQMKPTDDVIPVKPIPGGGTENNIEHQNIQAAWSHFHPEKEELVEDYKGTGIYSYVKKTPPEKSNYLKTFDQNIAPQPIKQVVKTFKKDVEEAVKYNHISSVDIALSEQKRRQEQERAAMMNPSTGEDIKKFQLIMYIIIGLILIGSGIALIYFFIIPAITQTPATEKINQTVGYSLLRTEEKTVIDLNKIDVTKLAVVLRNAIETNSILPNNIQEIAFSKTDDLGKITNIDSTSFLSLVGINPPIEITRDLQKTFIYGLHNLVGNQPFLILYTGAYSSGFNGMWAWQKLGMIKDFKKIFNISEASSINSTSTKSLEQTIFQDTIIRSLNSWVVKNNLGEVIFAYTIYNSNTIIISTNIETIKTIVDRMVAEKTQTR